MPERDRTDPKAMQADERVREVHAARERLSAAITQQLTGPIADLAERMFREGVIAGLRVSESAHYKASADQPLIDASLRCFGSYEDLRAIVPHWCECACAGGNVCSPRRRPAICDVQAQREIDDPF